MKEQSQNITFGRFELSRPPTVRYLA